MSQHILNLIEELTKTVAEQEKSIGFLLDDNLRLSDDVRELQKLIEAVVRTSTPKGRAA
jgi:hypothetical protein